MSTPDRILDVLVSVSHDADVVTLVAGTVVLGMTPAEAWRLAGVLIRAARRALGARRVDTGRRFGGKPA